MKKLVTETEVRVISRSTKKPGLAEVVVITKDPQGKKHSQTRHMSIKDIEKLKKESADETGEGLQVIMPP